MNHGIFNEIGHFTGTEHWYRHPLNRSVTYTDGAKYVADQAGAYWLRDEIALAQRFQPAVAKQPFQAWQLVVTANACVLKCEDGNGGVIYTKKIPFTDFPEPGITLWCADKVILLPQEY